MRNYGLIFCCRQKTIDPRKDVTIDMNSDQICNKLILDFSLVNCVDEVSVKNLQQIIKAYNKENVMIVLADCNGNKFNFFMRETLNLIEYRRQIGKLIVDLKFLKIAP